MSRSYYVIELSARWLTVLLVALAVLMVLAFGLGYGAARSTDASVATPGGASPTPTILTQVIPDPTVVEPRPSPTPPIATATPPPMPPTAAPPPPTPTEPPPTPTARPKPSPTAAAGLWVQVLASSSRPSIDEARAKLVRLGFDHEHHQLVTGDVADGNALVKLRVGPFPDRMSADRVVERMRAAGFPGAWVVAP
ncbi:MAG: SPOR domain-containing protein [Thermoanaerobaculales bacterium]|jgi:cell division septation protein DedD|nr:SPOR domain-containing protein [Thermoanaerobaculales bacterium]